MTAAVFEAGAKLAHVRSEISKALHKVQWLPPALSALLKAEAQALQELASALELERSEAGWEFLGTTSGGATVYIRTSL